MPIQRNHWSPNMKTKQFSRVVALILTLAFAAVPVTRVSFAQQPSKAKAAATAPDYSQQLAAIEKAVDDKRKELGIPGVSLAIVKDDRIIYMKGLGLRNLDSKLPVTPNTLFAIGSATKAFTAMTIMMSVDQGRLSLEDSPKKFLPYFTLRD